MGGGAPGRLSLCFGAKPKQRPELEISDETGSGREKKAVREDRGSWRRETQRGSRQRMAGESGWL